MAKRETVRRELATTLFRKIFWGSVWLQLQGNTHSIPVSARNGNVNLEEDTVQLSDKVQLPRSMVQSRERFRATSKMLTIKVPVARWRSSLGFLIRIP